MEPAKKALAPISLKPNAASRTPATQTDPGSAFRQLAALPDTEDPNPVQLRALERVAGNRAVNQMLAQRSKFGVDADVSGVQVHRDNRSGPLRQMRGVGNRATGQLLAQTSSRPPLSKTAMQRKVVIDEMFTANTAILEGYLKDLTGLQQMVAAIESHGLNQVMAIDIYIEGGAQDEQTKAGSTVTQSVDNKAIGGDFFEVPMVKALIAAKRMMIKVKLNVPPEAYREFEEDPGHDPPEAVGEMIATLLHEVYLHVLPKMDYMAKLKQRYLGEDIVLDINAQNLNAELRELQVAMTHVVGADDAERVQHENSANWLKVLAQAEVICVQLTKSEEKADWDLAYSTVMSAVNDVMTHTVPKPDEHNLPNLTPQMPMQTKIDLYDKADNLAKEFQAVYSQKFPEDMTSEEMGSGGEESSGGDMEIEPQK